MKIDSLSQGLPVFQALSCQVRIRILEFLLKSTAVTVRELSSFLNLPISSLSGHLLVLKKAGLVHTVHRYGSRELFYLPCDDISSIQILFQRSAPFSHRYTAEISLGDFCDFSVVPGCGLATASDFIGKIDEPRYFCHPNRHLADILWLRSGYLEYFLPCFIPKSSQIHELSVSFEISSHAPNWGHVAISDLSFFLNSHALGTWKSPEEAPVPPGYAAGSWWYEFLASPGILLKLSVTADGTFLNGLPFSDVTSRMLSLTDQSVLRFRIHTVSDSPNKNGFSLLGKPYGQFRHPIVCEILYSSLR